MTASSIYSQNDQAAYGRLNGDRGDGWCSSQAGSNNEWLQVDIGKFIEACGLVTQGNIRAGLWVKAFKVSYSSDGANWETYRDESGAEMVRFVLQTAKIGTRRIK